MFICLLNIYCRNSQIRRSSLFAKIFKFLIHEVCMIVVGNNKTYCFEGIHLPRIYIQDEKKVKASLEVLHREGSLTNKEMAKETERVRSEDIREILYLLWRLGFGVDVSKIGRELTFMTNDKLQGILELDNASLKKLILDKLMFYNPFIAILDSLIEYKKQARKFTQEDITKDFHNGRSDGGRLDNTHPLLRWANDSDWGLVSDREITPKGIDYVNKAKKLNVFYFHHTVDLKSSDKLNIVAHIISDASFEESNKIITYEDIMGLIRNINNFEIDKLELSSILKELKKIGFPIEIKEEKVVINNKIYHDITPKYYIKFGLNLVDGIEELKNEEKEEEAIDKEKIFKKFKTTVNLIIHDEDINLKFYPKNSDRVSYKEFEKISSFLPDLNIKNIILPPKWKPLKVSEINGVLLSFVGFGGNLVIFHAPMGRIGSNRNLFNWLPYDLSRISFVHSNLNNTIKRGFFTFPFGEEFLFATKENYEEVEKDSKRYYVLFTGYKKGKIIFTGFNESNYFFRKFIEPLKNNVKINTKSKAWIYRTLSSLNRLPHVHTEYDLYPLLREIMTKNFNFKFDSEITGKPGQTDLFIESPFFCCCEVTPPGSNATGFSKVGEVEGHRRNIMFKDSKKETKRFGDLVVGACVIGPSFTIEAGEDKSGAVDMANAMKISLISYKDLYELVCLSEQIKLEIKDLKNIFFNEGEKAEASIKIYELGIEKGIKW